MLDIILSTYTTLYTVYMSISLLKTGVFLSKWVAHYNIDIYVNVNDPAFRCCIYSVAHDKLLIQTKSRGKRDAHLQNT